MTPASMRMLMILLFAAAVLNLTNYAFYWLYNTPAHQPRAVLLQKITSSSSSSARTRKSTTTTTTTPLVWTAKLVCETENQTVSTPGLKRSVEEPNDAGDYSARSTSVFDYFLHSNKAVCPQVPPNLGPEKMVESVNGSTFEKLEKELRNGGSYKPSDCIPRQSLAVIVPCRECHQYLTTFLINLHSILMKQQLDYQIFVIEQSNASLPFSRGRVLNAGYWEALHHRVQGWRCVIFHEPFIVPTDSRNLYRCSWYPRQLATYVERTDRSAYFAKFGGAIAISPEQFVRANGFSNFYGGSDVEYLHMHKRLLSINLTIERSTQSVGKYKSLKEFEIPSVSLKTLTLSTLPYNPLDGLTTLSYSVDAIYLGRTHTHINVSIDNAPGTENSWEKIRNQITKSRSIETSSEDVKA